MAAEPESEAQREIRLALVMNGGTSLAVWMGGVTKEVDAVRWASADNADGSLEGTAQFWRILLRGVSARFIVDVVAGSSAGGINGAILATAIARGRKLPDLRDVWVETADYDTTLLLRDPDSPLASVLDGDLFLEELTKTFGERIDSSLPMEDVDSAQDETVPLGCDEKLWRKRETLRAALARERGSPRAVTLMMTGTALHGDDLSYVDEIGQGFEHAESRVLFTFRRDVVGEVDQFADEPAIRGAPDPAPIASERLARRHGRRPRFLARLNPLSSMRGQALVPSAPVDGSARARICAL